MIIALLIVVAVSATIIWCCCSSDRRPGNQNPTHAASAGPVRQRSPEECTETGPMVYFADDRHNRSDREYRFNYRKVNGSWRAYILRMPDFCGRDSGGAATHRLYDHGRPYICWDSRVTTLREMQTISRVWANSIQEYIATGKRFGPH